MTWEDIKRSELYKRFQKAYESSNKSFNFRFGSLEYWSLCNQYIEFVTHRSNNETMPYNALFALFYNQLSDDVKRILL